MQSRWQLTHLYAYRCTCRKRFVKSKLSWVNRRDPTLKKGGMFHLVTVCFFIFLRELQSFISLNMKLTSYAK